MSRGRHLGGLAHRGWWSRRDEQNTPEAFRRAWAAGFGIETDLRDASGVIVVSHDPPTGPVPTLDRLLSDYRLHGSGTPLALNIKADGLAEPVAEKLAEARIDSAFVFDMSVPDMRHWLAAGVPVFTRHSDIEPHPALYEESAGVWLDAFADDWWTRSDVERHLAGGKRVAIVSPELHGRPGSILDRLTGIDPGVMVCTDHPDLLSAVAA